MTRGSIGRRGRRARGRRRLGASSTGSRTATSTRGRGDFFYLADAFLHGRTWLTFQPGPYDVILVDGRFYVPFAPFPAVAFMPLVAFIGPVRADQIESGINAVLAAGRRRAVLVAPRPDRVSRACRTGCG